MPYLYTLAYENYTTGMPIARPLFFADPRDERLSEESNAYMLGHALLVAPVLEEGARTVEVPLPNGTWFNTNTQETVEGGQTITADAPLGYIPVFQKAGTIVPTRPTAPHTSAQPRDTLALSIVPGGNDATFTLYEDDGETMAYADGAYALTPITQSMSRETLILEVGAASGSYDGMPEERTVQPVIHQTEKAPRAVRLGDESMPQRETLAGMEASGGYYYDAESKTLYLQARLDTGTTHRFAATMGGE
jgi:alpha-glucosidase (family GH31 glycosyl hydrolase)